MCEDLASFDFLNVHSPAYLPYVKEPTLNHSFMKTASSWRNKKETKTRGFINSENFQKPRT
jgi:hypothetical protein